MKERQYNAHHHHLTHHYLLPSLPPMELQREGFLVAEFHENAMGLEGESLTVCLTSCVTFNKLLSLSVHFLAWGKLSGDANLTAHLECP